LTITKIFKIVAEISYFMTIMYWIRFRLGLCSRPRWKSSQRFPRFPG